jgi:N-acetylglucosamine-6-phosphate deacetylase
MSWCSPWALAVGIFKSNGAVRLKDGSLTGSCTALSECVRNAVIHCGIKLEEALRAATVVPADLVGRGYDCGRIKIGSCQDMIAWNADLKVIRTWRQNDKVPTQ